MKAGYLGYVEPMYKGNERDGYIQSAGVIEYDLDSLDKEDLEFLKTQKLPKEQFEIRITKVHFLIDQYDRSKGNKFISHNNIINIDGTEFKKSLKESWKMIYDNKSVIFKDMFESSVSI